jgi:hypothetical protein
MTDIDGRRYRFIDPTGKEIGAGPLDELMAYLPDSRARKDAEQLIRDAAVAVGKVEAVNARVDSVLEREREVAERERALHDAAVRALCDSIDDLAGRLDAYERAQARAVLDSLPDPDHPQGLSRAQQDDWLPPSRLEAPHPTDKQQLEALLARDREADDADDAGPGDLPPELDLPAQSGNFVAPEDPAGTGTRSVSTGPQADARKPRPRKGKIVPQPISVSLSEE